MTRIPKVAKICHLITIVKCFSQCSCNKLQCKQCYLTSLQYHEYLPCFKMAQCYLNWINLTYLGFWCDVLQNSFDIYLLFTTFDDNFHAPLKLILFDEYATNTRSIRDIFYSGDDLFASLRLGRIETHLLYRHPQILIINF